MLSRPRNTHTRRDVCGRRRSRHQLAILAQPVDELVAERVLDLLTTPSFRESLAPGTRHRDDRVVAGALAELGSVPEPSSDVGRRLLLRPGSATPAASLPLDQGPVGAGGWTTPRAGRRSQQAAHRRAR